MRLLRKTIEKNARLVKVRLIKKRDLEGARKKTRLKQKADRLEYEVKEKTSRKKAGPKQKAIREINKEKARLEGEVQEKTGREEIEPKQKAKKETGKDKAEPGAEEETSKHKAGLGIIKKAEALLGDLLGALLGSLLGFISNITFWCFFNYCLIRFCCCFSLLTCLVSAIGLFKSILIKLLLLLAAQNASSS